MDKGAACYSGSPGLIPSPNFSLQIITDEAKVVAKDHYLALPLELIGENRFRATLVIQGVQESEQKLDHSLKISTRLRKDLDPIHSVTHRSAFGQRLVFFGAIVL